MALHDPIDCPARDELDELTLAAAENITAALAHGLPNTVQIIDEALGEYMHDTQARAELLRKTAAGENPMQKVLADLIHAEAEQRAAVELDRRQRGRRAEAADARADREIWNRRQL